MWQLVNLRTDSIYLLHICFNLRTVAAALVLVYSTDSSSRSIAIEAGQLLSVSRSCRAMGLGALVPRHRLWHGRPRHITGQRPGRRHVISLAAPPCMARNRHFAVPGK